MTDKRHRQQRKHIGGTVCVCAADPGGDAVSAMISNSNEAVKARERFMPWLLKARTELREYRHIPSVA